LTEGEPRFRIAGKQSTKNIWAIDGTVEHNSRTITKPLKIDDVIEPESRELGVELLEMIKATEDAFRKDGRKLVSDIE